jgi:tetratricopeptide (TPR) repeat protein
LVELIAGDPEVAEAELRRDYEELDRMGESNYRATIAGFLAEALYRQGRLEAAEEFARICREITAADDLVSQIYWRSVLGRALARRGEFESGRVLLMEAHEMIRPSDELDSKGKILVDLAEVDELLGRPEEAAAALEEAVQLFEAKGNVVSRSRARERLVNLHVAPENPVSPIAS